MSTGAGAASSSASDLSRATPDAEDEATERARTTIVDSGATSDERQVVDAILAGDAGAFRQLVERESRSVIATCTRILGDRAEAEDVAQEAFVIAYRSLASWRADGPFGAWLSRIAVRLAVRRAAQRKQVAWLDPIDASGSGDDRVRAGGVDGADPASSLLRSERDAELRAAVASLDEPYREVVAMRFFAERSLLEIAAATDRPLGTVKTHLHRGLARLRRTLDETDR
ncbi:MAG TPA: sigma-70 family RNA polymerase sigma factor, partial [Candidatus Limnocylindrales bacterium]